jgi:flavin reductase (DIM6/NTAB) family NADH-FMN oxidoreductase RutF
MDGPEISALFADLDRELWLITAQAGVRRGGLIATFVSQASIVPEMPRVLVGVARQHHTWQLIEQARTFALHLLADEHLDLVWRFGLQSGWHGDKLEGLSIGVGKTGSPIWADALAWLEARVEGRLDSGDRTIYLAEVVDGRRQRRAPPLTVKRLLQQAPADKLQELKEQMARDRAVDAAAINAWRQQQGTGSQPGSTRRQMTISFD